VVYLHLKSASQLIRGVGLHSTVSCERRGIPASPRPASRRMRVLARGQASSPTRARSAFLARGDASGQDGVRLFFVARGVSEQTACLPTAVSGRTSHVPRLGPRECEDGRPKARRAQVARSSGVSASSWATDDGTQLCWARRSSGIILPERPSCTTAFVGQRYRLCSPTSGCS
jgi:hypothetical protein